MRSCGKVSLKFKWLCISVIGCVLFSQCAIYSISVRRTPLTIVISIARCLCLECWLGSLGPSSRGTLTLCHTSLTMTTCPSHLANCGLTLTAHTPREKYDGTVCNCVCIYLIIYLLYYTYIDMYNTQYVYTLTILCSMVNDSELVFGS